MTTAAWPGTLPQCPTLNYSEQRQTNVVTFQPEVGEPKMRRRSTATAVLTSMNFRMTNAQVLTFLTFYETTLKDGSLPFDLPHPVTKTSYTWVFDPKEAPRLNRVTPKHYSVSFNLLRLPA